MYLGFLEEPGNGPFMNLEVAACLINRGSRNHATVLSIISFLFHATIHSQLFKFLHYFVPNDLDVERVPSSILAKLCATFLETLVDCDL